MTFGLHVLVGRIEGLRVGASKLLRYLHAHSACAVLLVREVVSRAPQLRVLGSKGLLAETLEVLGLVHLTLETPLGKLVLAHAELLVAELGGVAVVGHLLHGLGALAGVAGVAHLLLVREKAATRIRRLALEGTAHTSYRTLVRGCKEALLVTAAAFVGHLPPAARLVHVRLHAALLVTLVEGSPVGFLRVDLCGA